MKFKIFIGICLVYCFWYMIIFKLDQYLFKFINTKLIMLHLCSMVCIIFHANNHGFGLMQWFFKDIE